MMEEPEHVRVSNSILESVKEQEAQFERLTQELEAERRSVVDQLEQCKVGSQVGSMRSLSSPGVDYVEQGPASITSGMDEMTRHLNNGADNDSTHLVDSFLKVLEERGIMQSGEMESRGKTVAFGQNETHQYNGYDSRGTNSTQNSYRHKDSDVARSQANYSPSNPAGDYISYGELSSNRQGSYRQSEGSYRQQEGLYRQQEGSYRQSEGSYRQSEGSYRQSEGSYRPQEGSYRQSEGSYRQMNDFYPEREASYRQQDSLYPEQGGSYRQQNKLYEQKDQPYHQQDEFYRPQEGSYRQQDGSYRQEESFDSFGDDKQPYVNISSLSQPTQNRSADYPNSFNSYREQGNSAPSDHTPSSHEAGHHRQSSGQLSQASQDLPKNSHSDGSTGFLEGQGADYLESERTDYSKEPITGYQEDNRGYQERGRDPERDRGYQDERPGYLEGSQGGNQGYEEKNMAYNSPTPTSNGQRFSSYQGGSAAGELYAEERPTTSGNPYSRQSSYADRLGSSQPGRSSHPMLADPELLYGSRQSINSRPEADNKWKPPDIPEVIEYLSHPNTAIKANAAAYLQHLSYGNNEVKARTGSLGGINALVRLLREDVPEVHRNALGALLNLSRGYENDNNKRAIKTAAGIEALAALLERSRDNDVRELITGILWNLSSLGELKKPVVTRALKPLVNFVILPSAGLPSSGQLSSAPTVTSVSWSTEFRNATGVLRNVSSDGLFARKQLRDCDGLLESLLSVIYSVIGRAEMDNKPVENIVCTLRNLSFRLMEVDYPTFYETKLSDLRQPKKSQDLSILGCFGKSKESTETSIEYPCRTQLGSRRGEQLWQPELVDMYLPLLSDCSNTDTLEAAVGAIQNLTACEWQPSIIFREHIRKKRGLPTIVELLGLEEADNVVCGAAIALRNLALDKSNKTLIGKYAIQQLVSRLPPARGGSLEHSRASEETVRAVLAALHEVLKDRDLDSAQHASTLVNDSDGLRQLMNIAKSQKKYTSKTLRCTHHLLTSLWRFSSLRDVYKLKGYKESDFLSKSMVPKSAVNTGNTSASSTLTRPRSEPPSNSNTIARTNGAFRDDRIDERAGNSYPMNGTSSSYPSNGTLPIQRPLYQQEGWHTSHQSSPNYDSNPTDLYDRLPPGTYRRGTPEPSRTFDRQESSDYPNLIQMSQRFNQSHEALIQMDQHSYGGSQPGQPPGEPLYAKVDKRKSTANPNNAFHNPNYREAVALSMDSINQPTEMYSVGDNSRQASNAGVDSWV
ncbi:catenin delta-2-like isoform X2 [Watersipora subatra]|uniref:catenin delta-2-like isoform X2 n=1 Tax=Watersipora subatra TaxID=2589382 RepID=UPI00355C6BE3